MTADLEERVAALETRLSRYEQLFAAAARGPALARLLRVLGITLPGELGS